MKKFDWKIDTSKIDYSKQLGMGSFGIVYVYDNDCAIKVSNPQSLLEEVAIQSCIDSEFVVPILDIDISRNGQEMYFTMPKGESDVINILLHKKELNETINIKRIMYQMVQGVRACHNIGILHRDIKPANFIYFQDGTVKMSDFGLATIKVCVEPCTDEEVYTIWFRPPEIFLQGRYDFKADVWALAVSFYFMAHHKPLIFGKYRTDKYGEQVDEELSFLYEISKYFGDINEESWPGVSSYPKYANYVSFKTTYAEPKWIKPIKFKTSRIPGMDDFLRFMLEMNPENRPSIYQVCNHSFFDDVRGEFSTDCSLVSCLQSLENLNQQRINIRNTIFPKEWEMLESRRKLTSEIFSTKTVEPLYMNITLSNMFNIIYLDPQGGLPDRMVSDVVTLAKYLYIDIGIKLDFTRIFYKLTMNMDLIRVTSYDYWKRYINYYEELVEINSRIYLNALSIANKNPKTVALAAIMLSCIKTNRTFKHANVDKDLIIELPSIIAYLHKVIEYLPEVIQSRLVIPAITDELKIGDLVEIKQPLSFIVNRRAPEE